MEQICGNRKGGENFVQETLPTNQIHENQCMELVEEFCEIIFCLPLALNTWN
jgi:hypothetical protein